MITEFSDEIIDTWMALLMETTERDNFSHNSREYYKMFLEELRWNVVIAAAKYEEKVIAMTISVLYNDTALYYYGASTSEKEARKLASSYLTLWESMIFAQKNGAKYYDLFGVADPENPNDPLAGVSQFKQKLGWELIRLPPKRMIIISQKFFLYKMLVKIKKIFSK